MTKKNASPIPKKVSGFPKIPGLGLPVTSSYPLLVTYQMILLEEMQEHEARNNRLAPEERNEFTSFSPAGQEGRHRPNKHSRMDGKEEGMSHENKRSISHGSATISILGSRRMDPDILGST